MSFGCAVNCIDGRAQLPIIEWIKFHGSVQYVDMITEPGADGILSGVVEGDYETIYRNISVSVEKHSSSIIALAGHFDCAGNPVSNEEHIEHIKAGVETIVGWFPALRVVGLFVNDYETVDVIFDNGVSDLTAKSFL